MNNADSISKMSTERNFPHVISDKKAQNPSPTQTKGVKAGESHDSDSNTLEGEKEPENKKKLEEKQTKKTFEANLLELLLEAENQN